jgi:predicted amidohydrolase YtcJ
MNKLKHMIKLLQDKLSTDLVLQDGNIICMDLDNTTAQAVAVKGGKIIAVGSNEDIQPLVGSNTEVISLRGKTVLPGFIESHFHPDWFALSLVKVNLDRCTTIDEVLRLLKGRIEQTKPSEWVEGCNSPSNILPGTGELDRWRIDTFSPRNPVYIGSLHHLCCVNSYALNLLNITKDTPTPEGWVVYRDASGEPTGILADKAWGEAQKQLPLIAFNKHVEAFKLAMGNFLEAGITTIHDALGGPEMLRVFQALDDEQELRLRVHVSPDLEQYGDYYLNSGIHTRFGSEKLRFQQMKILLNTFSGATAALFEDYANEPGNRGYFLHTPRQVEEWVANCIKNGWSVHTHVMGDREMDMVLTAYEKALDWYKKETGKDNSDLRLTIAHYGLYNDSLLKRTAASKILVVISPYFRLTKGKPGGIYEQRLGHERWKRCFPVKTLFDNNIAPSIGSDAISSLGFYPALNIYALLDGCGQASEVITPYQALQAYTINGAYALFREHEIGSIEIGKLADFVVLSENPLTLSKERIWDVSTNRPKDLLAEYTIVGGKIEYRREAKD